MRHIRLPGGLVLAGAVDPGQAIITAEQMFASRLTAQHIRDGKVIGEYDFGSGLVTTEFVNALAASLAGTAGNITLYKFHDSGTGTTAAAIGDGDLQTPAGQATRATGSQSATTNVYTTVGTIAYVSTLAITEWGLFTTAARGTTEILDRKVFSAVNVVSGDSIQFTYALTVTAGG